MLRGIFLHNCQKVFLKFIFLFGRGNRQPSFTAPGICLQCHVPVLISAGCHKRLVAPSLWSHLLPFLTSFPRLLQACPLLWHLCEGNPAFALKPGDFILPHWLYSASSRRLSDFLECCAHPIPTDWAETRAAPGVIGQQYLCSPFWFSHRNRQNSLSEDFLENTVNL